MGSGSIVVFGSLNMDIVSVARRLPRPGETVPGSEFYTTPGGKGANQAVACARLGAYVQMVGHVGGDNLGRELINSLESESIGISGINVVDAGKTGVAMISVDDSGENTIVAVYGANMLISSDTESRLESALADANVLLLQNEIPMHANVVASRIASTLGITVIWDPAPAVDGVLELSGLSTYVTPNQIEAEALAGIKINDIDSAMEACGIILAKYDSIPVITLGEKGVVYASLGKRKHVAAMETSVIDTVAAGDAFTGALAVAIAEGLKIDESIRFAVGYGALAVSRKGAQASMGNRKELDDFLKNQAAPET